MKKCQKQSGTDEFWPKNEYRQIASSFGQHACLELNRVPGVLLEPYEPGGSGECRAPHCIERVKVRLGWEQHFK